jgi:hypothetical protein
MALVKLSGKRQLALRDALVAAYLTEALFDELLLACEQSLDALAPSKDPYPIRALAVIKLANQQGWIADLIALAHEQHVNDPVIRAIDDEVKAYVPPAAVNPFRVCYSAAGCPFRKLYPDVMVVQSGQDWDGDNDTRPLDCPTQGRVFA